MAVASIFAVLLITEISRCKCDYTGRVALKHGHSASKFGNLLKPPPLPPLPPLSQILPVPFHGGRNQRQNTDVRYGYQSPPTSVPNSAELKFPEQFYQQYNFNFLRSSQPFTTTSSPSLFQKVSTWFFPSQQTSSDAVESKVHDNNKGQIKKDCNPCNLVPWIPVIKYNNLGAKNINQNSIPTYGPPSPTSFAQNVISNQQHHFPEHHEPINIQQPRPVLLPHTNNAVPIQNQNINANSLFSSTYGPPSPTHVINTNFHYPPEQPVALPTTSYLSPSFTLKPQSDSGNHLYIPNLPQNQFRPSNVVSAANTPSPLLYVTPSPIQNPSPFYGAPNFVTNAYKPVTSSFVLDIFGKDTGTQSDVEILKNDENLEEQDLPEVINPTKFKNSYEETVTETNAYNYPYSVSAIAAESTKIHTEVLPETLTQRPNISLALANPAPFTLNRGRNIHTLQPVALPNLSVSPLPPIFNARPFRPEYSVFPVIATQSTSQTQTVLNNINIAQSVPVVEFTHSVDYPPTFIQSPVIDIDTSENVNQTKAYRNIASSHVINESKDITSQASEDHISATKSISDSSFESTGSDVGNNFNSNLVISSTNQNSNLLNNHQFAFADLKGSKDEDVDKYRTENNLQNIDSPLLYLKPNIPHKKHVDFMDHVPISVVNNDYEIYDETPTITELPTKASTGWEENSSEYGDTINPPLVIQEEYKPKIVQIIVPYTMTKKGVEVVKDFTHISQSWTEISKQPFQARKVPTNTENTKISTENYSTTQITTTEEPLHKITENYNAEQYNSRFNNAYDVDEAPFDIVKLQHTIDDWTEQEYSKEYKKLQTTRNGENFSKQIPDEYFITTVPTNYETETNNYNYDIFDHESASSIQYSVAEERNNTFRRPFKEYNTIERTKSKANVDKSNALNDFHKLHIYTAASSFRTSSTSTTSTTTTTTPAPWGKIQTSISPLTKEKVYVVTSKPWMEYRNLTNEWYSISKSESKENKLDNLKSDIASDGLPFQSPRFINRPSFGFTSGGKIESVKSDYGFSRSWYQSINNLENHRQNNTLFLSENFPPDIIASNAHEDVTATTIAKPYRLRNV